MKKVFISLLLIVSVLNFAAADIFKDMEAAQRVELDGDYYKALELYRAVLQKNSAHTDALAGTARSYFYLSEYEEALKYCRNALKFDKGSMYLKNLEGRILTASGELEAAAAVFSFIQKIEPNNPDAIFGFAELDVAGGKLKNAVNRYLQGLRIHPENKRALLSLAILFNKEADPKKAELYIRQALRYYPDNPDVRYAAAKHYFINNFTVDAKREALTALALNPLYYDAKILLCSIYLHSNDYSSALYLLKEMQKNAADYKTWYLTAYVYLKMGEYKSAVNAFKNALSVKTDDEISLLALEDVIINYYDMNDEARIRYENNRYKNGRAFEEKNMFQAAMQEYRRALLLNPYSRQSRLAYAGLFYKQGYTDKYLEELKVLKYLGFEDTELLDELEILDNMLNRELQEKWRVSQYETEKNKIAFSVFYSVKNTNFFHYRSEDFLVSSFITVLNQYPSIAIMNKGTEVKDFSNAFREARSNGSDYFIILDFEETERLFSAEMNVYLAASGSKIASFPVYRTGNSRIINTMIKLSSLVKEIMPVSGIIIDRKFDSALINLGSFDGIKKDDKLLIVKKGKTKLSREKFEFEYKTEDYLGALTVVKTDEQISEGIIKPRHFFDTINAYDVVLFVKTLPEEPAAEKVLFYPELFSEILKIR